MKILVVGATGPTGKEIVAQALAAGHQVTALVRDVSKADFSPEVRTSVGDMLDRGSLKPAVAGQDAVISAFGSGASGPFKEVTLLSEGTRNLVEAMTSCKVARLICITGVGAGESKGHGPWFYNWLILPLVLRGVYADKTRQEAVIRDSGLDWTLVRPAIYTKAPAKGLAALRIVTDLTGTTVSKISRVDTAAFCLREMIEGRYRGQAATISY